MRLNFYNRFTLLALTAFLIGVGFGHKYLTASQTSSQVFNAEKNTPRAFLSEAYDKIKENYWDNISDAQLIDLFKNASSALGNPIATNVVNKEELIKQINPDQAPKILAQVLSSLNPIGRSGLYTQKLEEQLKNTVSNINPQKDLYKDLGLSKGASAAAINQAYQKQAPELEKQSSPEAKEKLKALTYAKDVLSQGDTKQRYDSGGVEPTISTKVLGNTLYLQFKKFSPTSLDEFQKAFESNKDANLDSLIFDLRGNIGGAIDSTPYFFGIFHR